LASEKASTSPRAAATAASCVRTLPPRGRATDDVRAGGARPCRRVVGRAVARDDDLEAILRPVEGARVGDLCGDDVRLAIRRHDERDERLAAAAGAAPPGSRGRRARARAASSSG
jgi:hypothetical protein